MGEYALYGSTRVKIGTCEDMYYLRADQRFKVKHEQGNVDPVRDVGEIRFRFPFPDEDGTHPGDFDPYNRAIPIPGMPAPPDFEHYGVQFTARGYVTSLPCPENPDSRLYVIRPEPERPPEKVTIHRNGFAGAVRLRMQRYNPETKIWMAIFECGGCEAMWRVPTLEDLQPYLVAINAEIEHVRRQKENTDWWTKIRERILQGYEHPETI